MSSQQLHRTERQWKAILACRGSDITSELSAILPKAIHLTEVVEENLDSPMEKLLTEISRQGPDLCFLDLVTGPEEAFGVLSGLIEQRLAPAVIALLPHDNPELVLRCLRRGAAGTLLRPFSPDQLEVVLRRITDLHPAEPGAPSHRARTFAVIPAEGSCGATTVASNLACYSKSAGARAVLLADMDPLASTLSFQLKLRSQYSFMDALSHPAELDAELWKALVANCRGVDILPSPDTPCNSTLEDHDPATIIDYARGQYQFIFLDLGSPYGRWNTGLAGASDELLIVLSSEASAIYSAERTLVHLDRQGVGRTKIRIRGQQAPPRRRGGAGKNQGGARDGSIRRSARRPGRNRQGDDGRTAGGDEQPTEESD